MIRKGKGLLILFFYGGVAFLCGYSNLVFAMDPATKSVSEMNRILFGTFGTSLAGIIVGGTFLLAKLGKITWDRFIFIGICTAGFLGAPSIVSMIKGWV